MIKIFIPKNKGRVKSIARGFWYSKDTKKTYYDYIDIVEAFYYSEYRIETIQYQKNQECIFFIDNNIGNIFYSKDKIIKLQNKKVFYHNNFIGLKDKIKELLRQYEGLTIYIESKNQYRIEVFYA